MKRFALCFILLGFLVGIAGCPPIQQQDLASLTTQIQQTRTQLAAQTQAAATAGVAPDAKTLEYIAKIDSALAKLQAATAAASTQPNPGGSLIGSGAQAVAPFLPPPWNAILFIAAPIVTAIAGWLAQKQKTNAVAADATDLAVLLHNIQAVSPAAVTPTVTTLVDTSLSDSAKAILAANAPTPAKPIGG